MTFRSPWSWFAGILQVAVGLPFLSIGIAPDASLGEKVVFAALGFVLLIGAARSFLMKVNVSKEGKLALHGYVRTRTCFSVSARPEVIDDKVFAAVWAPIVSDPTAGDVPLTMLSGYGRMARPNRRVERVCAALNKFVSPL